MRARSFMFVCAGVLMLVAAYQLGVQRAEAQLGGEFVGIAPSLDTNSTMAITSTGDVYARDGQPGCSGSQITWVGADPAPCDAWTFMGNVLGGTVSVEPTTTTDVKKAYREED